MGFIRQSLENLASQIVVVLCQALVAVLTARLLGVTGRGEYALFVSLVGFAAMSFHLGVPQANVYFHARKNVPMNRLAMNSRVVSSLAAVICFVVLLAFREPILRRFLPGLNPLCLWLVVPATFFLVLDWAYGGMALGGGQFRLYNIRQGALPAVVLVATVASLIPVNTGIEGAVLARVLGTGVVAVWFVTAVGKRVGPGRASFDAGLARETLAYGMKSHVQTLLAIVNYRLGLFLLSFLSGQEAVGYYSVAVAAVDPASYVASSFGTILFPKLSSTEPQEAFRFTCVVCRNILVITVGLCVCLLVVGRALIVVLFGEAYIASVAPMYVLLPGAALRTLQIILTRNFTSRNKQQVSILATAAALGLNLLLNMILAPRYGAWGTAMALSASYGASGLILMGAFVHDSRLPWRDALVPKREDAIHYRRLLGIGS